MKKKIIIALVCFGIALTLFLLYKSLQPQNQDFLHDISARLHKLPEHAFDDKVVFDCRGIEKVEKNNIRVLVFSYPSIIENESVRRISFEEINYNKNSLEPPSESILEKKTCTIQYPAIPLDYSYGEENQVQDLTIFYLEDESDREFLDSIQDAWVYIGTSYSLAEYELQQKIVAFSEFHR